MARKIARMVYFDAEQEQWLRDESSQSGAAITEIVRRLVDDARGRLAPIDPEPDPTFTGTLCPGRDTIRIAAEDAHSRGLITDEQYDAQIDRLGSAADKWPNLRVLRDFQQAPASDVTLGIAREVIREQYPNASIK